MVSPTLTLVPATERVEIAWRQPNPLTTFYQPAVPIVGLPGVNARVQVAMAPDRWILFTGGPAVGPTVLFWGLVVVLVLIARGLGRSRITPLRSWDWLLLGLGLSQAGIWVGVLFAGWLFALGLRSRLAQDLPGDLPPWRFNLMQTGFVLLSLAALFAAVEQGLLGLPEMQIAGNGSTAASLDWYQDRSGADLPGGVGGFRADARLPGADARLGPLARRSAAGLAALGMGGVLDPGAVARGEAEAPGAGPALLGEERLALPQSRAGAGRDGAFNPITTVRLKPVAFIDPSPQRGTDTHSSPNRVCRLSTYGQVPSLAFGGTSAWFRPKRSPSMVLFATAKGR